MREPRVGDAFGEMLHAALAELTGRGPRPVVGARTPVPVMELVERDDGFLSAAPAARYLAKPPDWPDCDRAALRLCAGRVLDVGAGGGRFALALQERGAEVTALDISPGAIEVCRRRGVRDTFVSTVENHVGEYDTFLLWCNNLGLLGTAATAPGFLRALGALAAPGARLVGQGTDPYATTDPVHLAYQERNRRRGRMAGQLLVRLRYRAIATEWFEYLLCAPAELRSLAEGTGWRLEIIDATEPSRYTAVLRWCP
jgi:SAM-dependent methyltransferase